MFLFRLVYYSRNHVTKLQQSVAKEIRSILDACMRNNPPANITGALVFNDQYFAQILEGDRSAVTSMFCKIIKDPRHSEIVMLKAEPTNQRMFLDWSMAYAGHSESIDKIYMKHAVTIGLSPARMTAESLTSFIADLVTSDARVVHTQNAATAPAGATGGMDKGPPPSSSKMALKTAN